MSEFVVNDSRADTGRGHGGPLRLRRARVSSNLLRQMAAAGGSGRGGPSERSTSEMRPRLHSFGCAGAFHRAPSELRVSRRAPFWGLTCVRCGRSPCGRSLQTASPGWCAVRPSTVSAWNPAPPALPACKCATSRNTKTWRNSASVPSTPI